MRPAGCGEEQTYKVRRGWGRCGGVGGAINGFKTGTISHHHPAFIKILLIFRFGAIKVLLHVVFVVYVM